MKTNDVYPNNKLRGHFVCEMVDKNTGEVVDRYEKHNMIMTTARTVMSRLFANMYNQTHPDKFILGTEGHKDSSILIPKDQTDGFVKEKTTLFSEVGVFALSGDVVDLYKNTYIQYTAADPELSGVYLYVGTSIVSLQLSDIVVAGEDWVKSDDIGDTYEINFELPGTSNSPSGDAASTDTGDQITVLLSGTTITFTFELGSNNGNGDGTMVYTEAGIYAGDELFCMKTFPAKVKDETVIMRVIWSIIF